MPLPLNRRKGLAIGIVPQHASGLRHLQYLVPLRAFFGQPGLRVFKAHRRPQSLLDGVCQLGWGRSFALLILVCDSAELSLVNERLELTGGYFALQLSQPGDLVRQVAMSVLDFVKVELW